MTDDSDTTPIPYHRLVDTHGAARRTGLTYATLRSYVDRGLVPYHYIDKHVVHDVVELDRWTAAKAARAAAKKARDAAKKVRDPNART